MLLSRSTTVTTRCETVNNNVFMKNSINIADMAYEHISLTGRISDRVEMCCNQCGNFTQILNTNNLTHDELIRREHNFRCDKCINISGNSIGSMQKSDPIHKTNGDNKKIKRIHDNGQDYHDDIIVSNGGGRSRSGNDNNTKPILKFSVSAILGDTREGVRVRNENAEKRRSKVAVSLNLCCIRLSLTGSANRSARLVVWGSDTEVVLNTLVSICAGGFHRGSLAILNF
uniref:Uncharacterized protein n=1 Tax=Glossina palpalis gambiensis TaxID=67801 RepID=A0A1B0BZ68_9MUSC